MISKKMEAALNAQINAEQASAHLYIAMSAYLESINWSGFAHWLRVQAKEETGHAIRLYKHIVARSGVVTMDAIAAPPKKWKSVTEIFKQAYEHELKITNSINDLVTLAKGEKDYASEEALMWFVKEQVEEEEQSLAIANQLELIKENTMGLFQLNAILGKRE